MTQLSENLTKNLLANKTYIVLIFAVIIIIFILIYVSNKLNLKQKNCNRLSKEANNTVLSINKITTINKKDTLNNYFIKTAYNCCCTGNFKNDYVDQCALKNCASYGVRALDFQIYSLKDKPIISASSVVSNQYKEMYNYIRFFDAMTYVKKWFVDDQSNANSKDPLFLIFRLHTTNAPVYNMMGQALNEVFGYASPTGNMIYILPQNKSLDKTILSDLIQKVVIIIDPTYGDKAGFENSLLSSYASLITGNSLSNNIYRESTLLGVLAVNRSTGNAQDISNNLTILYPDIQANKNNYDFITSGVFNNISFIGMNFQYMDQFLNEYNKIFSICAFLNKGQKLDEMCNDNLYRSTNICKRIKAKPK